MPYRNEKKKGEELLSMQIISPDALEKRRHYSMTGSKQNGHIGLCVSVRRRV